MGVYLLDTVKSDQSDSIGSLGEVFLLRVRVFVLLALSAAVALSQVPVNSQSTLPATNEMPGLSIGGPSIMTRMGRFGSVPASETQGLTYYGTVSGVYDTGRVLRLSDPDGNPPGGAFGVEGGGGFSLNRIFRHSTLLLSYSGTYRTYNKRTYNSGWNQALGLTYAMQLSRRLSLSFSEQGGTTLRNGSFNAGSLVPGGEGIPSTLPIDINTRFLSSGVTMTYQQSGRIFYQFGGDFFLTRYNTSNFGSNVGQRGTGSVNYRLSARTTINATYAFSRYSFTSQFGTGNSHTITGGIAHQFSPQWEAGIDFGVTHTTTQGQAFTRYLIDPVTGEIFGDPTSLEVFSRGKTFPTIDGRVSRNFRNGNLSVFGGQRVSSGNGAVLTSQMRNIGVSYSRRMSDNLGLDSSFFWSQMVSLATSVNNVGNVGTGVGANYRLSRMFGLRARWDYYHYSNLNLAGRNNNNRLLFGITLSPKSVPLF